jgi:hypothetical protein
MQLTTYHGLVLLGDIAWLEGAWRFVLQLGGVQAIRCLVVVAKWGVVVCNSTLALIMLVSPRLNLLCGHAHVASLQQYVHQRQDMSTAARQSVSLLT